MQIHRSGRAILLSPEARWASASGRRVALVGTVGDSRQELEQHLTQEGFSVFSVPEDLLPDPDAADLVIVGWDRPETPILHRWGALCHELPVVIVLPKGSPVDHACLLDDGAAAVWTEPGVREAVARVRALMRRQGPPRVRSIAPTHGLTVDLAAGVVRSAVGVLRLKGKRLETAAALLGAESGTVVTQTLLQARTGLGQSEVEGHIRRIRAGLEALEGWRRIATVRGVGYRVLTSPERPEPVDDRLAEPG